MALAGRFVSVKYSPLLTERRMRKPVSLSELSVHRRSISVAVTNVGALPVGVLGGTGVVRVTTLEGPELSPALVATTRNE